MGLQLARSQSACNILILRPLDNRRPANRAGRQRIPTQAWVSQARYGTARPDAGAARAHASARIVHTSVRTAKIGRKNVLDAIKATKLRATCVATERGRQATSAPEKTTSSQPSWTFETRDWSPLPGAILRDTKHSFNACCDLNVTVCCGKPQTSVRLSVKGLHLQKSWKCP